MMHSNTYTCGHSKSLPYKDKKAPFIPCPLCRDIAAHEAQERREAKEERAYNRVVRTYGRQLLNTSTAEAHIHEHTNTLLFGHGHGGACVNPAEHKRPASRPMVNPSKVQFIAY